MKNTLILIFLFLYITTILYSENLVIGCDITSSKEESCDEGDILKKDTSSIFKLNNLNTTKKISSYKYNLDVKRIKITKKISSIKVKHQKKSFTIERYPTKKHLSCPPSCIQPINIETIKTVGTLETLKFIDSLNKNRRIILIDSRSSLEYKKETIPTATNIPYSILKRESKYTDVILKLLGAKKTDEKWSFNNAYQLLIFDNGIWDTEATKIIYRLIELKYPQNKILYYYGGFNNWKEAGLTTSY